MISLRKHPQHKPQKITATPANAKENRTNSRQAATPAQAVDKESGAKHASETAADHGDSKKIKLDISNLAALFGGDAPQDPKEAAKEAQKAFYERRGINIKEVGKDKANHQYIQHKAVREQLFADVMKEIDLVQIQDDIKMAESTTDLPIEIRAGLAMAGDDILDLVAALKDDHDTNNGISDDGFQMVFQLKHKHSELKELKESAAEIINTIHAPGYDKDMREKLYNEVMTSLNPETMKADIERAEQNTQATPVSRAMLLKAGTEIMEMIDELKKNKEKLGVVTNNSLGALVGLSQTKDKFIALQDEVARSAYDADPKRQEYRKLFYDDVMKELNVPEIKKFLELAEKETDVKIDVRADMIQTSEQILEIVKKVNLEIKQTGIISSEMFEALAKIKMLRNEFNGAKNSFQHELKLDIFHMYN